MKFMNQIWIILFIIMLGVIASAPRNFTHESIDNAINATKLMEQFEANKIIALDNTEDYYMREFLDMIYTYIGALSYVFIKSVNLGSHFILDNKDWLDIALVLRLMIWYFILMIIYYAGMIIIPLFILGKEIYDNWKEKKKK